MAGDDLARASAAYWLLNGAPDELAQSQLALAALTSGTLWASLTGGTLVALCLTELVRLVSSP